ncbi:MAG: cysteine desulfurase family protein [Pseudomonadota bacterium]
MSGRNAIYLDHQATTPCDRRVVDAMLPWLTQRPGNPHSATHDAGRAAHRALENARAAVAALIGAQPEDIVFTSGATEATNIALRGLRTGRKSHVLTSAIEHSCVRDTLKDLKAAGTSVSEVPVDADGLLDPDEFAREITAKTAMATVMAANNEMGTLQPIAAIGHLCREAGVVFHTDAAQAAGKIPLDVSEMNIDLMSISGHKMYGPQGVGALYCRADIFPLLKPLATGGGQERGLRPGTVPVALCVGLGEACAIALREMESDRARSLRLRATLLDVLTDRLEQFQVNGSLDQRLPGNLNLWFEGVDAEVLLSRLPDVAMSMGSACSSASIEPSHVLLAMGLTSEQAESSIRIGFGRGTTDEDVAGAAAQLAEEVTRLRLSASSPNVARSGAAKRRVAL